MMKPNAEHYNPDPGYLRQLIDQVKDQDLMHEGIPSQRKIAAKIGVPERTFRGYLTNQANNVRAPYSVQYCLEALAGK